MMQKNTCGLCERRRTEKEHLIILHKRSRLIARLRAPPLTHRSSFLPLLMQLPLSPFLLILLLLISRHSSLTPLHPSHQLSKRHFRPMGFIWWWKVCARRCRLRCTDFASIAPLSPLSPQQMSSTITALTTSWALAPSISPLPC